MNEFDEIGYLLNIPEENRGIDDWKKLLNFFQSHANFMNTEFSRVQKENLDLRIQLEKLEGHFDIRFGLPRRIKSKGLLQAPRGRPKSRVENILFIKAIRFLRNQGYRWNIVIGAIDSVNQKRGTSFPTAERYLRELINSAE